MSVAGGTLLPDAFVAVTVMVKVSVPGTKGITPEVIDGPAPEAMNGPSAWVSLLKRTSNWVAKPSAGVKVTVIVLLPLSVTPVIVGVPGTGTGVTLLEAADAGPVPTAFVAVTVKV